MRLLLDTNILIPLVQDEAQRLAGDIRHRVSAEDSVLHASAASMWELAIKVRSGKLVLGVALKTIPALLDKLDIDPIAVTFEHALAELRDIPPTKDPFDRILLAQCQVEGLTLVTTDRALSVHPLAWREA